MTRPTDPFEAVSYDLNKFWERRVADRRLAARDTPDRRKASAATPPPAQPERTDGESPDQSA